MWAFWAAVLYRIADYFWEKHERKTPNNAANSVDAMPDDTVKRVLERDWTKH